MVSRVATPAQELQSLLQAAQDNYREALVARQGGDLEKARKCFLLSAERLLQAASLSSGELRASRKHLAGRLIKEADFVKSRLAQTSKRAAPPISEGTDEKSHTWLVEERPNVKFDDVAGLLDVKEQIWLKLLYPFSHPELAERYSIQSGGGILLYGPPGTGKTLIARAVAGEIEAAFFAIKPSEVMSQWVGVAEQNIARLFVEAGEYPISVIFIDEIESLAPKRRTSSSTVMQRVVPQLLAELDGFHKRQNAMLFIGATNEPWSIDTAVLRPGRLDRLIYVPPPDYEARLKILQMNLYKVPIDQDVSLNTVAERTQGFSGADMAAVAREVRERVFIEAVHQGIARPIGKADFETILAARQPSLELADLRKFECFRSGD